MSFFIHFIFERNISNHVILVSRQIDVNLLEVFNPGVGQGPCEVVHLNLVKLLKFLRFIHEGSIPLGVFLDKFEKLVIIAISGFFSESV